MAERRAIASNIWDDAWFGMLDPTGMTLWIGLFSRMADDQGRLIDNSALIGRRIFTYRDVPASDIEPYLKLFAEDKKIIRYKVGKNAYIQIINWWENQPMQYAVPSNYPPPPDWIDRYNTIYKGHYIIHNWLSRKDSDDGVKMWGILKLLPKMSTWTTYLEALNPNPNPNHESTSGANAPGDGTTPPEPPEPPTPPQPDLPRTDRAKKGDAMDAILLAAREAEKRKSIAAIPDYPPDVQDTLRWFYDRYLIPIPAKPKNRKSGGEYAHWIDGLRDIQDACAWHGRDALEAAFANWKRNSFSVSHPGALVNTVKAEASVLSQRQAQFAPSPAPDEPPPGKPIVITAQMRLEAKERLQKIAAGRDNFND